MQTRIEKLNPTEEKVDKMCAYAGHNCKMIGEQISFLKKQQDAWFAAYHNLRALNDCGNEIQLSEARLKQILEHNAKVDPQILAAMLAVEKRGE